MKTCLLLLAALLSSCGSDVTNHSFDPNISAAQSSAVAEARAATEAQENIKRLGLQWSYWTGSDDMTSGTVHRAVVHSLNEVAFAFPYQGAQRASLEVRTHPRWGKEIILSIERGQFLCEVGNCWVTVRFDDGRPWQYSATGPADHSSTAIFIQAYADIVKTMKTANRVRIQARIYQQGAPVFEFDTSNLTW